MSSSATTDTSVNRLHELETVANVRRLVAHRMVLFFRRRNIYQKYNSRLRDSRIFPSDNIYQKYNSKTARPKSRRHSYNPS
jgi:hypothetical protein